MTRTIEQIKIIAQEAFPRYQVACRIDYEYHRHDWAERGKTAFITVRIGGQSSDPVLLVEITADLAEDCKFNLCEYLHREFDEFIRRTIYNAKKLYKRVRELEGYPE